MKFGKYGDRNRKQQAFDKEKIFITRAGQTVNVYDSIQAANVDTDIYEVMKKYHCSEEAGIEFLQSKGGMKGIYADVAELQEKAQDLGELMNIPQQVQELFENLPVGIKEKYGNNPQDFVTQVQKEIEKIKAEKSEEPKQTEPKGENNNETK